MRISTLGLVLLVLAGGGCTRQASAPVRTLKLSPCRLPGVDARLQCGNLKVWEDRAAKKGRKISLRVAVLPALSPNPAPDPLFILAGGPGQAATQVAGLVVKAFSKVHRDRDLVFVDQRGTGHSNPLDCGPEDPHESLDATLHENVDALVKKCLASLEKKANPALYTTPIAMDDLDQVRAALGYDKIDLWGGSYGTRAALVYARRHGAHLRAMVLDGVVPTTMLRPLTAPGDAQRALDLLFDGCRKQPQCNAKWPKLKDTFDALLKRLAQQPERVTVPDPVTGLPTKLTVDRAVFTSVLRQLLYEPMTSALVPLTLARAEKGDFRPFAAEADLGGGMFGALSMGMYLSVTCAEDVQPIPQGEIAHAIEGTFLDPTFPTKLRKMCAVWPKGTLPKDYHSPVHSKVPTLLFSGALDPITPPRWAEAAAKTLPNSLSVVVPATGHGTLARACVRRLIAQFLKRGTVKGLKPACAKDAKAPSFFIDYAGPPP